MAGPSHTSAVDPKSIGPLLDPECGIPFDVFFDLEDEADTRLGMIGGHKNILALKSSVFKAMFFGSLRETGDQIQIKATSMGAFKKMLQYAYGVEEEWYPWSLDIKEMFHLNSPVSEVRLSWPSREGYQACRRISLPKGQID